VHDLYPEISLWKNPPYEYETEKMPIDILCGTDRVRKGIGEGEDLGQMEAWWKEECFQFGRRVRKQFLLYE